MQDRYKDDTLAAVAYNMGPGATDTWLQKGGSFNQLPKETQDYIGRVHVANALMNRPQASATSLPTSKKEIESQMAVAETEKKKAAEKTGEREANMLDLAGKANETMRAADTVTNIANQYPEVQGIGKGLDTRSAAAGAIGMFAPRMNQKEAEEFVANKTLSKDQLSKRDMLDAASKQLGIDYAANAFKGSRMGVGLEKMAVDAKGVGTQYTSETNKANAAVIKEAAKFNQNKLDLWKDFKKQYGDDVSFQKFEESPEYRQLEEQTQKNLAERFPKYFSQADSRQTTTQTPADAAAAELARRRNKQ
jgi:hypothetical protein